MNFEGKVAIVTGAGSERGIGRETCKYFSYLRCNSSHW